MVRDGESIGSGTPGVPTLPTTPDGLTPLMDSEAAANPSEVGDTSGADCCGGPPIRVLNATPPVAGTGTGTNKRGVALPLPLLPEDDGVGMAGPGVCTCSGGTIGALICCNDNGAGSGGDMTGGTICNGGGTGGGGGGAPVICNCTTGGGCGGCGATNPLPPNG